MKSLCLKKADQKQQKLFDRGAESLYDFHRRDYIHASARCRYFPLRNVDHFICKFLDFSKKAAMTQISTYLNQQ